MELLCIWETPVTSYASMPSHRGTLSRADETLVRLDAVLRFLDRAVRDPGTSIRFGADSLLNVIPSVGALATKGLSAYLIWEARRLGVLMSSLLRMIGSVGLDVVISAVPVLGWLGDAFYRSNLRNMDLLREHANKAHPMSNRFRRKRPQLALGHHASTRPNTAQKATT